MIYLTSKVKGGTNNRQSKKTNKQNFCVPPEIELQIWEKKNYK